MSNQLTTTANEPTRVVVLGSGYAGMHACCELADQVAPEDNVEIVLISKTDHLLYVTMTYEVVAGNLAPSSIRQSVRTMINAGGVQFLQGAVTHVDFDNQVINYESSDARNKDAKEARELSLSYDYLVSATGSETEFFGTPGAAEYTYTLKTLADAQALKNKLINHFEEAALVGDVDKQRELLSIVIVGGGPTGVTLAAKIADLLNDELAAAFPELASLAEVTILEAGERVLGKLDSWFSRNAMEALAEKGCVQVLTNHCANEVHPDGVVCDDAFLRSQCVIWTAGVKAREFEITAQKPVEVDPHSRRIHVTEYLHTLSYENVFVAGDQAWVERGERGPYPMRAQFAVREGHCAGANVLRCIRGQRLQLFSWADKGLVVSLGEGKTFAEAFGFRFSGPLATLAYKSIYLMSTIGIRAKLRAVLEWTMNLFLPRDVSEL